MARSVESVDHAQVIRDQILTQYRETVNLKGYTEALLAEADTLEDVFSDVIEAMDVDNAVGDSLDKIGLLVGQSRTVPAVPDLAYFGFQGATNAGSYGDLGDPSVGERYRSLFEAGSTTVLVDEDYRLYIKARIARNHFKGDMDSFILAMLFIFSCEEIQYSEGAARITVGIGRILTANEKQMALYGGLIPKPGGVTLDALYEYEAGAVFGYAGAPGALGYDSGAYASLIS